MSSRPRRSAATNVSYLEDSDDDLIDSDLEERAAKVTRSVRNVDVTVDENDKPNRGANIERVTKSPKISSDSEQAQENTRRSARVRRPPSILEMVGTKKETKKHSDSSRQSKRQRFDEKKKQATRIESAGHRSSSRAANATRMMKCHEILKETMKSEIFILKSEYGVSGARWFTDPVDPIELEIPDYLEIIKNPMDLLTVKKNLDEGVYDEPEKFLEHVRLVFSNAVTYNTDPENPVHIVAKKLSEQFEEQVRDMKLHWNARSVVAKYEELDSDDDEFLETDDEEVKPKRAPKCQAKRSQPTQPTRCTIRQSTIPDDDSDASDESSIVSSALSMDADEDDTGSNEESVQYRVQHILANKFLTQTDWRAVCDNMNTREVTRGSVWKQSDGEYYDSSSTKIEKFLVKWMHASFLHVSWEKEEDLLTMVGPTAKAQLRRYRERQSSDQPELFEDLGRGDYFPPSYLDVERVLDVDDPDVVIQTVDYVHAAPNGQEALDIFVDQCFADGPMLSPFAAPNQGSILGSVSEPLVPLSMEVQADDNSEVNSLDAFEFSIDGGSSLMSPGKPAEVVAGDIPADDFDLDMQDEQSDEIDSIGARRSQRAALLRSPVSKKAAAELRKDSKTSSPLILHGENCWVTVKWAGLPYEDATFEHLSDLRFAGIEYEVAMRSFYKREQRIPVCSKKSARSREVKKSLDASLIDTVAPKFAAGSLRDYQWEGVRWLLFNWSQRRNSILADEMGLGKTIQSAAFLQLLKRNQNLRGPFLIVAPLSTVMNWQREIEAWTDMDAIIYHGSQEDRQLIREYEFFYMSRNKADGYKLEVVITTPETCLALDKQSINGRIHRELSQIHWEMLIVDEAHKLKNHNSKFCSVIREEYSYQNCLLLTGTPLQNNTEELWTLLNFIDRRKFEDKDRFIGDFGSLTDASQLQSLHQLLKPYLLRREKENVEKDVPPKEEVIVEVELTISQKQYYRAIYEQNTQFLYKGAIKDGPRLTNLAMELRKCCNHPFLVKGAEGELVREAAKNESISNSDTGYVDTLVQSSGKMVLLDKLLPRLQAQGHRVLIFSQFRIMLDIIEDYLLLRQFSYDRIDGAITGRKRQAAIDKFCAPDSSVLVMLLSTKAGGVGINLTAADTVIIFDSDWNPQNDLQAQARCHRIGQTRPVKVYRLLTKKSYEMHMFHTASLKLGLAYAVAGNAAAGDVLNGEMIDAETASALSKPQSSNSSSLTRKELEKLLRHGAYDIFSESKDGSGEAESRNFCEANIDQILERSSVVVHDSNGSRADKGAAINFSTASFVSSTGQENSVAIDDPEFWSKVVGLAALVTDDTVSRRRKCRDHVSEGTYKEPGMRFLSVQESDSDASSDVVEEPKEKRLRKSEKSPVYTHADFSDPAVMTRLTNALLARGYGNWAAIQKDSRLRWKPSDIAQGCRIVIFQNLVALYNLGGYENSSSEKIKTSRESWSGVNERLSLSPTRAASSDSKSSELSCPGITCTDEDVSKFCLRLQSSNLARLAIAAEWAQAKLGEPTEVVQPIEDDLFATILSYPKQDSNAVCPLFVLRDSEQYAPWNKTFYSKDKIDEVITLMNSFSLSKMSLDENAEVAASDSFPTVVGNDKNKQVKSRAEDRLSQLEDLLDFTFAHRVSQNNLGDDCTSCRSFLAEYLKNSFDAEDNIDQPLLSVRIAYPWWTEEIDALMIEAVHAVGWPDNKKRYSNIESFMAQALVPSPIFDEEDLPIDTEKRSQTPEEKAADAKLQAEKAAAHQAEVVKKAFPNGFPFKDRTELSKRLRELIKLFKIGYESSGLTGSKKLIISVLKALGKMGRPRTVYEGMCKVVSEGQGDSLPTYKTAYLLDWETFTRGCGVRIMTGTWISRVKDVVSRLIAVHEEATNISQKVKGAVTLTVADDVLNTAEITLKTYFDSMDRCEGMHRVRTALGAFSDEQILEMLMANPKIPTAGLQQCPQGTGALRKGEKERERDSSLPVWWSWNNDLQLLQAVVQFGFGKLRNDIEKKLLSAPADFELPVMVDGVASDKVTELNLRVAEKRFHVIAKHIHPIKWLKLEQLKGKYSDFRSLPPASPNDKVNTVGVAPVVKPRLFQERSSLLVDKEAPVCSLFVKKAPVIKTAVVVSNGLTTSPFASSEIFTSASADLEASITTEISHVETVEVPSAFEPSCESSVLTPRLASEAVDSMTAPDAKKMRKPMSEEAKASMKEKRKATLLMKKDKEVTAVLADPLSDERSLSLPVAAEAAFTSTVLPNVVRSDKPHAGCRATKEDLLNDKKAPLGIADDCPICFKRGIACEVGCHPFTSASAPVPEQPSLSVDKEAPVCSLFVKKAPVIKAAVVVSNDLITSPSAPSPSIKSTEDDIEFLDHIPATSSVVTAHSPSMQSKIAASTPVQAANITDDAANSVSGVCPAPVTVAKPAAKGCIAPVLTATKPKVPSITSFFKKLEIPLSVSSAVSTSNMKADEDSESPSSVIAPLA